MVDDISSSIGKMVGTAIVAGFGLSTLGLVTGGLRRKRRRKKKIHLYF